MDNLARLAKTQSLRFGDLMQALRLRSGLSARSLSALAGVSPSYVSKMEREEFIPTLDTFSRLVAVLECSDAEILFLVRVLGW